MIIRPRPHGWQHPYILRGSIVPAVAPKVVAILLLAIAVAAAAEFGGVPGSERVSSALFALPGLVLSIFLSFRNSACYPNPCCRATIACSDLIFRRSPLHVPSFVSSPPHASR